MPTKERFRFIKGFNKLYKISNFGYVLSCHNNRYGKSKTWRLNIGQANKWGYRMVHLFYGKHIKTFCVHKLVCEYFIPNPNNHSQANHLDKNKLNCHVDNLEWVSHRENGTHRWLTDKKTSRFIGVFQSSKTRPSKRWRAAITFGGAQIGLGSYKTEEEAHLAYLFALEMRYCK